MSVNPSIRVEDYYNLTGEQNEDDSGSEDSDGDYGARSQEMAPRAAPGANPQGLTPGASAPISLSDRFERRGVTLLETNAIRAYDFHNNIPNAASTELYANEFDKHLKRFNAKFLKKYVPERPLVKVFPQGGQEKDLIYKKGGSRRRAYTGREAAEAEETEVQQQRRRASNEVKKIAQHKEILKQDEEARMGATPAGDIDFSINNDNSDIEFLGVNDIQGPYQQVPKDIPSSTVPIDKGKGRALSSSSAASSLSGVFQDIDEMLAQKKPPAPLISLSQVKSESQLPSQLRAPTSSAATATRGAQGVKRKKTKAQKEKESQDRHRIEEKVRWKEQAAERKVRKEEKKMLPRKDDISQLIDHLLSSSI